VTGVSAATTVASRRRFSVARRRFIGTLTDDELLDAVLANPILINRPFVVTPNGVRLCRLSEVVLDILPLPQKGPFSKEDGEVVIDAEGRRVNGNG
jgi:arsenate reductase